MTPSNPLLEKALQLENEQHFAEALALYEQIPENEELLYRKVCTQLHLQQTEEAKESCKRALHRYPHREEFHLALSDLLKKNAQEAQALRHLQDFYDSNTQSVSTLKQMGFLLNQIGQTTEAQEIFSKAIKLSPRDAQLHFNLGIVLTKNHQFIDAIKAYEEALELRPDWALPHWQRSQNLLTLGQIQEALEGASQALALDPSLLGPHSTLAYCHHQLGDNAKSVATYHKLRKLDPHSSEYVSLLLYIYHFTPEYSSSYIFREHRKLGQEYTAKIPRLHNHPNTKNPQRLLRVGFVSGDFVHHSVTHFIEPLVKHHHTENMELIFYHTQKYEDEISQLLANQIAEWHNVHKLSDEELFAKIVEDRIDILFDLSGHTRYNRALTFARKPAPIQITYLGYPSTSGIPTMDYRLTDEKADPPSCDRWYTESLLRMPQISLCYAPIIKTPDVSETPFFRKECFTFGSFNNAAKINDYVIETWSQLLHAAPRAKLLLKNKAFDDTLVQETYLKRFQEKGISTERLEFIPTKDTFFDHLATYAEVDLALDPFPYNGTTTTCEALWMGVPVLSLWGSSYVSRISAAILSSIGLHEFTCNTKEEYVEKAIRFAQNPKPLSSLRLTLRERMLASPLCDGARFAQEFEQLLRKVWKKWCET